jgi:hypothetical protein
MRVSGQLTWLLAQYVSISVDYLSIYDWNSKDCVSLSSAIVVSKHFFIIIRRLDARALDVHIHMHEIYFEHR